MRSWYPIPAHQLDNKRLLGEHLELHTMNSVILKNLKGYSRHPETLRWKNHTRFMVTRHNEIEEEMRRRGMKPKSPMEFKEEDLDCPPNLIEPLEDMLLKLRLKQDISHEAK